MISLKRISRPFREQFLWRWEINPEKIEKLKKDLEALGPIEINYYKSLFSRWSLENEVTHTELSDIHDSNHADILLNNKIIIQLFQRSGFCSGALFEENLPTEVNETAERILLNHGYRIGKKENPHRKRLLIQAIIISNFLFAFLWISKFWILRAYFSHKYSIPISHDLFEFFYPFPVLLDVALGIIWVILGFVWFYRYRKTTFKG